MKKMFGLLAGLIVIATAFYLWPSGQQAQSSIAPPASRLAEEPETEAQESAAKPATGDTLSQAQRFNEAAFVQDLRQRFAPHLHIKHAQIRSLEQLMSYLKAQYPEDWESRVLAMLQQIFPQRAEELYERFLSLQQYTDWLIHNRSQLRAMSREERQTALWQAREQAFGAAAQDIWAAELRSQTLAQSLQQLPQDMPVVARADAFRQSIENVYGEQAEQLLNQRRSELLNHLLDQAPVQAELASLPSDQRRDTLRAVRASMGMPQEALERWETLDQSRDSAWTNGQSYMQARQDIQQQYPNEAQWRIDQLRAQHFGDMAAQIAQEEQAGFYRYAGPRSYGRE